MTHSSSTASPTLFQCQSRLGNLVAEFATADCPVRRVVADSRQVMPGDLFVAISGSTVDGCRFIDDAIAKGAAGVLYEGSSRLVSVPAIRVADSYRAWGILAEFANSDLARRLTWLGVTGTNGKSTTALLLQHLLRHGGLRCGLISTIHYDLGDGAELEADRTTPMPETFQQLAAEMVGNGCTHAVTEVSSHALAQGRMGQLPFAVAGFTNLTRDHLDYHLDMEQYFAAKSRLFRDHLSGSAVIMTDCPWGQRLAEFATQPVTCALTRAADWRPTNVKMRAHSTRFRLHGQAVETPLVGPFNIANTVLAIAMAVEAGIPIAQVCAAVAAFAGVPGRLEHISGPPPSPTVLVDYAHTDDALTNVLAAARELTAGRLIVVFGCGGNRDRGKRPRMAQAAEHGADVVIVTSDNPRGEAPTQILADIRAGFAKPALVQEICDRREAIVAAITKARPDDVVLIAGKGHETYQEVCGIRNPFDDRQVVKEALGATS